MKKEAIIYTKIKLIKNIVAITVGLLTIIAISISIGVSFGRNAAIIEMNQILKQVNK